MELTVEEIMEIGYFKFSYILNGKIGLANKVSCVTIMDIPHITSWLRGNELLISGIYLEESFTREFIDDLLQVQCSGIITKEKFTLNLQPELVEYCSAQGLPIIIAPDHCSWSDMMNPVNNAIIEKQYKSIEDTNRFHNILIHAVVKENSLINLCHSMIQAIGLPAAITTSSYTVLAASEGYAWDEVLAGIAPSRRQPVPIAMTTDGYPVSGAILPGANDQNFFLYPIRESGELYGYICVAPNRDWDLLPSSDIIKIQFSGLIFALKVSQQKEIENSTKYYHSLILNEILFSAKIDQMDIPKYDAALGKNIRERYRIVMLSPRDEHGNSLPLDSTITKHLKDHLADKNIALDEWLIFEYKQMIVLFLPVLPNLSHSSAIQEIQKAAALLEKQGQRIYCSTGNEHRFPQIKQGYQEALQALRYSVQNKRAGKCVFYQELGVLRFLTDHEGNLNMTFMQELLSKYIVPLQQYDEQHQTNLLQTMQLYIANNLSSVRTCEELFIHKNTLRARFKTIEKLINAPLTGDELFHMQLALKVTEALP